MSQQQRCAEFVPNTFRRKLCAHCQQPEEQHVNFLASQAGIGNTAQISTFPQEKFKELPGAKEGKEIDRRNLTSSGVLTSREELATTSSTSSSSLAASSTFFPPNASSSASESLQVYSKSSSLPQPSPTKKISFDLGTESSSDIWQSKIDMKEEHCGVCF